MPKKLSNALDARTVKYAKAGRHADGGGLHLLVKKSGARSWVFRYMLKGKSRDLGLSRCSEAMEILRSAGHDELTLAQARDVATIYRLKVKAGIDPIAEREDIANAKAAEVKAQKIAKVRFKDVAQAYIDANEDNWKNSKHRQQWKNSLATYVYPVMGDLAVSDIETNHVLAAIEPIWREKAETASRVRGRIETVLDAAKVRGYRTGENPARWRGHLSLILPARTKLSRGHHKAEPYHSVPQLLAQLRSRHAVAALALEFTILTAARTGEVIGATWNEIDIAKGVWTIPSKRMKAGREHRVPLAKRAMEIVQHVRLLDGSYVFSGPNGGPLSGMAMAMLLRRMKTDVTVHGFRSSFRDWAAECTGYPHEVCEMALAHAIGNKAEAAYRRGDLFDKRRRLMDEWAEHCNAQISGTAEVVPLRGIAGSDHG
jgi:integrase